MNITTEYCENIISNGSGLLDKVSRMLVRTNPKLSTNVKIMTNGEKIWLESYDADKNLADSKYKAFVVSSDSKYNKDVVKFYGTLDTVSAFRPLQQYDDLSVKDVFDSQYETFYHCGCEYVKSLDYDEQFGFVAPLWIDENIPEYFVIFKVEEPSYFNLVDNGEDNLRDMNFKTDILDKCTIVKTFSLKEDSPIGKYIRNYRNQDKFPVSPLYVRMEKGGYISFNGISYKTGEFTEAHEHDFERMFTKDETVTGFDNFITGGFERNGIICANLLNLEFLFDDTTSEEYTINRYFGLYCNMVAEGTADIDYAGLYGCGNLYSRNVKNFDQYTVSKVTASNNGGVLIPVVQPQVNQDEILDLISQINTERIANHLTPLEGEELVENVGKICNISDILFPTWDNISAADNPSAADVDAGGSLNGSVHCIVDRLGNIHSISRSNSYPNGMVRLTDKKVELTDFNGFVKTNRSVTCEYEDKVTPSQLVITINSEIEAYTRFTLKHDNLGDIGYIECGVVYDDETQEFLSVAGWYDYDTFSGIGDLSVVAQALADSFNAVFENEGLHAYYYANNVVIEACNSSDTYNLYHIECENTTSVPVTSVEISNGGSFCGANDYSHIKIMEMYSNLLQVGEYLPTRSKRGYGKIIAKTIDFEKATIDGDRLVFNEGLYYDVLVDENNVFVNRTNTVRAYDEFDLIYGRLSFFPVHDFDFQTTAPVTQYGDFGELEYERCYLSADGNDTSEDAEEEAMREYSFEVDGNTLTIYFENDDDTIVVDIDGYNVTQDPDDPDTFIVEMIMTHYNPNYVPSGEDTNVEPDFDFSTLTSDLGDGSVLRSEYMRLYENFSNDFMLLSKTVPYINKWVYHDNGFDVRERKYRLNTNPVFGMNSFAPDPYTYNDVSTNPNCFGCEWYYIFDKFPHNEPSNFDFTNMWSYIGDVCPIDSGSTAEETLERMLLDTKTNYFNVFFVRDHIVDTADANSKAFYDTLDYVKKYSLIENGSDKTIAETFFRGAKIEFLQKTDYSAKIDNNINTIKIKSDNMLNGYKFTSVIVPIETGGVLENPRIRVIRNDVFKFIVMVIFVVRKYKDVLDSGENSIPQFNAGDLTRYLLYNPQKVLNPEAYGFDSDDDALSENGIYGGERRITVGGRGKVVSITINSPHKLKGDGTNFINDFSDDSRVMIVVKDYYDATRFNILKPTNVEDNCNMVVEEIFDKIQMSNTQQYAQYAKYVPLVDYLTQTLHWQHSDNLSISSNGFDYCVGYCDATVFADYYNSCDFFNIVNNVNYTQKDDVVYIHVDQNGVVRRSDNNEYTYALRFVMPADNAKYEYLDFSFDGEIVSYFDNPKYAFRMHRYGGWFEPLTKPVIYFKDPFVKDAFNDPYNENPCAITVTDTEYLYKKLSLLTTRYLNTAFAYNYKGFGMVKQLAYHRVNDTNNNPFKLKDGDKPLYPVSNKFAIGYRDVNVFNSSWDLWYFVKTNTNTDEQLVHGTCSMLEKFAMLGSKCMTLPDTLKIEDFTITDLVDENYKSDIEHTVFRSEKSGSVSYVIMVERRLKAYLHGILKDYFARYVLESCSYGDRESIDDDIDRYIEQNIIPLYMFDHFDLYVKKTPNGLKREMKYDYVGSSDAVKLINGLRPDNSFGLSVVDYSEFDKKIVLNTKEQYTYEIAFTLYLKKR